MCKQYIIWLHPGRNVFVVYPYLNEHKKIAEDFLFIIGQALIERLWREEMLTSCQSSFNERFCDLYMDPYRYARKWLPVPETSYLSEFTSSLLVEMVLTPDSKSIVTHQVCLGEYLPTCTPEADAHLHEASWILAGISWQEKLPPSAKPWQLSWLVKYVRHNCIYNPKRSEAHRTWCWQTDVWWLYSIMCTRLSESAKYMYCMSASKWQSQYSHRVVYQAANCLISVNHFHLLLGNDLVWLKAQNISTWLGFSESIIKTRSKCTVFSCYLQSRPWNHLSKASSLESGA